MSNQRSWICDGEPKDGQQYPNASPHEPQENFGPDCVICGLPREAMVKGKHPKPATQPHTTTVSQPPSPIPKIAIAILALLVLVGGGFGAYKLLSSNPEKPVTTSTPPPVSQEPVNTDLISYGEKILLDSTNPQKQAGSQAFASQNWDEAISQYQQASNADPNDPESKIYGNNAKAKKAGQPLTMAVVVPITPSADAAKEVLRGVALAQDQYNQSPKSPEQLLQVVIVNEADAFKGPSLAQDLINNPQVLGVLGHGVDMGSQTAVQSYEQANLTVLSPINTSVVAGANGQSTLKTLPIAQKANELFSTYLQAVSKTLVKYAAQKSTSVKAVIFYNSDSPYSQQLRQQLSQAVTGEKGQVIQEVDVTGSATFDPKATLNSSLQKGANVGFLALSKNQVNQAVAIAQANSTSSSPLTLLGSNELYTPSLLVEGQDATSGIILAVPWRFQPTDPFASLAQQMWKGRVSWRTATAYDATQALATAFSQTNNRAAVFQMFNQGLAIAGTNTDFRIFNEVPLVQAVEGAGGPKGSNYRFDPIQ